MRCPFCGHMETQVKDSRQSEDGATIRRRRHCDSCKARFTTFERVHLRDMNVIKAGGKIEPFDREKLHYSMKLPLRKRPVKEEELDLVVNSIVRQLELSGEQDIPSRKIGAMAMEALADLDKVAYIRYASVYKDFREISDFNDFLDDIGKLKSSS